MKDPKALAQLLAELVFRKDGATRRFILYGGLLLAFVATGLTACSDDKPADTAAMPAVPAEILKVEASEIPVAYVTSGSVTSDHRVSISSRLSGYIREMRVREGDTVKQGDVLVRVDPVDARQALIQAQADLADAKADADRYAELLKEGAVTSQQADKVMLRYKVAKSQVEQARNQLGYAELRSPVAGVVVEKRLNQGDLAAPGVAILTLEDPASLLVETYVSERYVSSIHEGDSVDIEIASLQHRYEGTIRQVVQAADPVSHQFLVKIALPAASEIHPGMYAQSGFRVGMRRALLIPRQAVISRAGMNAVYLLDPGSVAHYRLVRLGEERGGSVEVLAGLNGGDRIAWNSDASLQSGVRVTAAGEAR